MEGLLHDSVPLVMLLHEHLETAEGDAEHFSELHWVNGELLRMEHARFLRFDVLKLFDLRFVPSDTL